MNATSARHCVVSPGGAGRRLVAGLAILAVTGGLWRLGRPLLIVQLAKSSLGCPYRGPLLAAGLRLRGLVLPEEFRLFNLYYASDEQALRSYSLPRPGWIVWYDRWRRLLPDGESHYIQLFLAGADLTPHGSVTWDSYDRDIDVFGSLASPPGDYDGDGRWEIVLSCNRSADDTCAHAVLRLGATTNEVVAYVVVDKHTPPKPRPYLRPLWGDTDADGLTEFRLTSAEQGRDLAGRYWIGPPQTYAVFSWTRPGGTLTPTQLPAKGGVYFADLGGEAPSVSGEDDIAPLLQRLRPVTE